MNRWRPETLVGILAGALLICSGCRTAPPPAPPPPPKPWSEPPARTLQVRELADRNKQLQDQLAQLPGSSADEHRQIVAGIFDNFSKMVQLAQGTDMPPNFTNRLMVIIGAQEVLSDSSIPRERMEAVENDGTYAILSSLQQIIDAHLWDDQQLPPMLDDASVAVKQMEFTRGPMHDLDASTALKALGAVMQRVSDDLYEEFGQVPPAAEPAVVPATVPATEAATAPTTEPATAPTTAPTTTP
jgi:hypothetical protein